MIPPFSYFHSNPARLLVAVLGSTYRRVPIRIVAASRGRCWPSMENFSTLGIEVIKMVVVWPPSTYVVKIIFQFICVLENYSSFLSTYTANSSNSSLVYLSTHLSELIMFSCHISSIVATSVNLFFIF